jgi:AcrR family transcriptional regulator
VAGAVADASARPAGPRSRKGVRTRARLVESAKQVFEEQGFLDARVSDIAERAGLSHGSFYHYFESKEEVFVEVAAALEERISAGSLGGGALLVTNPDFDTTELVRRSVRTYLEHYRADAAIMGVIEQVTRYHDEFRQARNLREARYTALAVHGVARLQAAGRADPGLEPQVVGPALMGTVTRFAEMWLVQGTVQCSIDEAVDNLATLLVNALGVVQRDVVPRV